MTYNSHNAGGAENAVPLHVDIFRNCFVKKTGTILLALTADQTLKFHRMEQDFMGSMWIP
jgi:hypothetical protein